MIKKQIKQYKTKKSSTSNIPITKNDIKELDIEFKETNKNYLISEEIILLNKKEYDKISISENIENTHKKELETIKQDKQELKDKIKNYDSELSNLKIQYSNLENKYQDLKKKSDTQMEKLEEYNTNHIKEIKKNNELEKNYNTIINNYQLIIKEYETSIQTYNNLNFLSRLFNTNKINFIDKDKYKLTLSSLNIPKYIPVSEKKEKE